jgi:hypothetical protein
MLGTACHPNISKKAKKKSQKNKIFQKNKYFQKIQKIPKTAFSAPFAAFATSTSYLASLVCLIVLQKQGKNKS